jgi:hypothetical protein
MILGFARRAGLALACGAFGLGLAAPLDVARRGVAIDLSGARLEIGRVGAGSWWPAALAQSGDTVTLNDVKVEFEATTIVIPRLEVDAPSLSRTDLLALLHSKGSEPWAAGLARFSVRALRAAEVTVEQRNGSLRQTTVYRDVRAENVVNGRLSQATAAGATVQASGPDDRAQSGRVGRLLAEDLDLAEVARIAWQPAGSSDAPLRTVQGSFVAEGLALEGSDGSRVEVARIDARDIRAKPVKNGWSAALAALAPQNWTEEAQRSRAAAAADVADAFAIGSMELSGLVIGSGGDKPTALRIARMAYSGAIEGRLADARIEGVDLTGPSHVEVGTVSLSEFSWESSIQGLRALAAKPPGPLQQADFKRLFPATGALRAGGIAVDVPDPKSPSPAPGGRMLAIREMEFVADRAVEGRATDARLGIAGLTFPIPAESPPEVLKPLADMGYRALDVSFTSASNWDPATGDLTVRDLSLSGQGMGGVNMTGVLGRVDKDALDPDPAVSLVALLGATAKNAQLTVSNEGLVQRLIADQAAKRGKSADELRRDLGSMAAVGVAPMLGNGPGAQAIGQALARFIAKPGKLTLSARAKDAGGLGIADISALGDAASVLDRLEVTATAE